MCALPMVDYTSKLKILITYILNSGFPKKQLITIILINQNKINNTK